MQINLLCNFIIHTHTSYHIFGTHTYQMMTNGSMEVGRGIFTQYLWECKPVHPQWEVEVLKKNKQIKKEKH